jgi:non-ribosomal peptide synthetase-like protein
VADGAETLAAGQAPPAVPSLAGDSAKSPMMQAFAELLADIVGAQEVSPDSHFFDDLGADSLLMTRFCARVRKRPDLPSVSMKDIYRCPTLGALCAALVGTETGTGRAGAPAEESRETIPPVEGTRPAREARPVAVDAPAEVSPAETEQPGSTALFVVCGAAQLVLFCCAALFAAVIATEGYDWVSTGAGVLGGYAGARLAGGTNLLALAYAWLSTGAGDTLAVYLRSVLFTAASFAVLCVFPIVAKWLLVGRWKPGRIRVWSLGYLRFWVVKTLVRSNPLVLFVGTPIYPLYLRALGAKVGRGVAVFSRTVPVCTDLLTIGDRAVIRKDTLFTCYRAHAGAIQTGRVTIGADALVSEASVLDIDTSLGRSAQLGHASSLHPGQVVPDGERWHGVPGRRTEVDFRTVSPARCGWTRRFVYSVGQLLKVLVVAPLVLTAVVLATVRVPRLDALMNAGPRSLATWPFYRDTLVVSAVLFAGVLLVGLLVVATVPRLLNLFVRPGRSYPLYGFRYGVHRTVARLTNIRFFTLLFGDSSAVVGYLRWIGYRLSPVQQTGSNFGTEVKHENPYTSHVGSGTMVADGLSVVSADYSSSSFRVCEVFIGRDNFLGNHIAYPSRGRTGDNCLLATKVMVPIDGEVRQGVGLLGSPSFEIPRTVERDHKFDDRREAGELRRGLAAKNRHNVATMVLFLLVYWLHVVGLTLLAAVLAVFYRPLGVLAVGLSIVAGMLFTVVYFVLVERAVQLFRPIRPLYCSIYDRRFWRHERFWKTSPVTYQVIFNGTPFKNLIWRLLGVRLGRRVFDDGCVIPEKSLVSIGDDCTLNLNSRIQCHSQEDGAFKSDRTEVGSGVTIGVNALVHYGVTIGDGAVLDADAFLMKGEQVTAHTWWSGNPAAEVGLPASAAASPVAVPVAVRAPEQVPVEIGPALPAGAVAASTAQPPGRGREELARSMGPAVSGELPGPRSVQLANQGDEPDVTLQCQLGLPVAVAEAGGSFVRDVDGNVFVDLASGADPLPLGHHHPVLTSEISTRLAQAVAGPQAIAWVRRASTQAELSMLPAPLRGRMGIQFGAPARGSAADAAIGLCRAVTGRRAVVALRGEFSLERVLHDRAGDVRLPAAVLISMTDGPGGVVPARREFVHRVRQLTRELGIPLVVDETGTDAGRTGTWFAFEQYNIEPDVVVCSRALTGFERPTAVVLYDARMARYAVDAPGDPGSRIALLAGMRMADVVRRDDLLGNARARGEQLRARLAELRDHPAVLDVHGRGLMWGIELMSPVPGRSASQLAVDVRARMLRGGVIVQLSGPASTVLRIQPPLTVRADVIDTAVSVLADALTEAARWPGSPGWGGTGAAVGAGAHGADGRAG